MHPVWRLGRWYVPLCCVLTPCGSPASAVDTLDTVQSWAAMVHFSSSGAVEDRWDESHLAVNRAVAGLGMSFGSVVSIGVRVVAAMLPAPPAISPLHLLDARNSVIGYAVPWDQLELSDPDHPRLCCDVGALEPLR